MAYPDPRTALANERIADWLREAERRGTALAALPERHTRIADLRRAVARRCIIRAALRARRSRLAAASDPRPAAQPSAAAEQQIEHLCDEDPRAAAELVAQPERQ
jgi:hypothetical protein